MSLRTRSHYPVEGLFGDDMSVKKYKCRVTMITHVNLKCSPLAMVYSDP